MSKIRYVVATESDDTTRNFYTLLQALDYYERLEEAAEIWDFTSGQGEIINTK